VPVSWGNEVFNYQSRRRIYGRGRSGQVYTSVIRYFACGSAGLLGISTSPDKFRSPRDGRRMSDPKKRKHEPETVNIVPSGGSLPSAAPQEPTVTQTPLPASSRETGFFEAPTMLESTPPPAHTPAPNEPKPTGPPASRVWSGLLLQPDTLLGTRYRIVQLLGEGGMGAVYKAKDIELDRLIALKVIRPELASNPEILQRFKQELILAREVTDRNVIRIFDLGESDGIKFITMEFVEGESLYQILRRQGKLEVHEAVEIMKQMLTGLRAAHREGVIHRDLKPGNIMRDAQGRVVIMDFGLARSIGGDGMTRSGTMLGTMEYMSPEQAQAKELDARSDLFTLGLICYELLTGKMPYQADSAVASLLKRMQERAVPASDWDASIPQLISELVSKCLERDPTDRWQSAQQVLDRIDEIEGRRAWSIVAPPSPVSVQRGRQPEPHPTLPRPTLHKRIWLPVLAATLVAVAVVAGWMLRARSRPVQAEKAVSVLVADFANHTGDPVFDGTLESTIDTALEGASFINAYSRESARKLAEKLPHPSDKLDEQSARLVAVGQSVNAVISGDVTFRGDKYTVSAIALDAVTGNVLANSEISAANKEAIPHEIPRLVAPIRKALGDITPESEQFHALSGAFSVGSLEAMHLDAIAMQQQYAGKYQEALESFSKAVQIDPNFAEGYAGMAAMSENLGKREDAERYIKLAMQHEDRMTERERSRTRGLYYAKMGDWQKCVDEYTQLVSRYPADRVGHVNLGICYAQLRNIPKAIEESKRGVELVPKGAQPRLNLAFYSSLGGDFQAGEREARAALELSPSAPGYLFVAESQLGQGQLSQAAETYHTLEKLDSSGASIASSGLADLAAYQGRFTDAIAILEKGAAADLTAKDAENAATKYVALGRIQLWRGERRPALEAADKAFALNQDVSVRFSAAPVYVDAKELIKAQKLASNLASELKTEPQVYGSIIEAKIALKRGDKRAGINKLLEANKLLDTWIGHFELGRAYLDAALFVEADSEFERCIRRRGEVMELFQDNVPTYALLPPVYYYQGRVLEGLKSPGYGDSYRNYLSIRGQSTEDPLVVEARKALGQ